MGQALAARFDWYQATLKVPEASTTPELLIGHLGAQLGGQVAYGLRGLWGYTHTAEVRSDGDVVARAAYGGVNVWPSLWASGPATDEFVRVIRSAWPEHWVSRADAAVDLRGDFDVLAARLLAFADDRGLSVEHRGDWHRAERGRTLYVGTRASGVLLRLYEKGVEQQQKGQEGAPLDWVRFELEVRPKKGPARQAASAVSADECWGASAWSQALAREMLELEVERMPLKAWRMTDDERALRWMVKSYGATLDRIAAAEGWAPLMRRVQSLVELQQGA